MASGDGGGGGFCSCWFGRFSGCGGAMIFFRYFSSHISEGKGLRNGGAEKWGLVCGARELVESPERARRSAALDSDTEIQGHDQRPSHGLRGDLTQPLVPAAFRACPGARLACPRGRGVSERAHTSVPFFLQLPVWNLYEPHVIRVWSNMY